MSSTKITMHDIDESVKEALSPVEHIENKENPHGVTAEQVGALKVYKNLTELGLTEATATAQQIVEAMENDSILLHPLSGTATGATMVFPYNYSLLRVTKKSNSYAQFEVIGTGNVGIYTGYYNGGASNKWSGWNVVYSSKTITNGTTDIGAGSALATGCIHLVYE